MHCNSCAANVTKHLKKQALTNVQVNFATGDVYFNNNTSKTVEDLSKTLASIGYPVANPQNKNIHDAHNHSLAKKLLLITLPFTAILMLHMLPFSSFNFLSNGYMQLALCTPVYIIGLWYFGKPAFKNLMHGNANMNLLIVIGASAAYIYSILGLVLHSEQALHAHKYLFFETAATIITFVLFGNWLEEITGKKTQAALSKLMQKRTVKAQIIAFDNAHNENLFEVEAKHLKPGDLIDRKSVV